MHHSLKAIRTAAVSAVLTLSLAISASAAAVYGQVNVSVLNVRAEASTEASKLGALRNGTYVEILSESDDGWYEISYRGGSAFVSGEYVTYDVTPTENTLGQQIASTAQQYLGKSYVYGATGPNSFDCSGFTRYVMGLYGISLPHRAASQFSYGYAVSTDELQAGDLVFFSSSGSASHITHVGLYLGGGQFIHASTNSYQVQINSIYEKAYSKMYVGARHVI